MTLQSADRSVTEMDAGRFESSLRPFALHRAIRAVAGPIGVNAGAKRLPLELSLDPALDALPGVAPEGEGLWVVGDEMRLRQILTNLASNAVKFTPPGAGPIRLVTKLIAPFPGEDGPGTLPALFAPSPGEKPDVNTPQHHRLVVRLEITDSGPGSESG
jgi:signal transduction histidine kinase